MSIWSPPGPPGKRAAPLAENYRETPLWWDDTTFPALGERRSLQRPTWSSSARASPGSAAAARLGAHGKHAVVVDSGALGEGASGRNAGMVHAGVRRDLDTLERKYGAAGLALQDASVEAYRFVAQTAATAAPDASMRSRAGCTSHIGARG